MSSFSFSKVLFSLFLALALAGIWKGFFDILFSFSQALFSSDGVFVSGNCTASNVDMLSKFGKAVIAFKVIFL